MTNTIIYALLEPGSELPRYIGKTVQDLRQRRLEHIRRAKAGESGHRAAWIRQVLAGGGEPVISKIDQLVVAEAWPARERFWIATARALFGDKVTNIAPGGEGVDCIRTPEWIEKIAAAQRGKKRRPLTPVHRAKIAAANMGSTRVVSPAQRAKISASLTGRKGHPISEAQKAQISAVHRGSKRPPMTSEQRARNLASLPRGEAHHQAKLTDIERQRVAIDRRPARVIAAEFGISKSRVNQIKREDEMR